MQDREVHVHLLPMLVPPGRAGRWRGGGHRRAAGHDDHHSRPGGRLHRASGPVRRSRRRRSWPGKCGPAGCCSAANAAESASGLRPGQFAAEYTPSVCRGHTLVLTTTNGTRALLRAAEAERVAGRRLRQFQRRLRTIAAGFASYSYHLRRHRRRSDAGGHPAGRGPGRLPVRRRGSRLNDGARLAWDCFETHGRVLAGCAGGESRGGQPARLGYDEDIRRPPRWTSSPWCRSCAAIRCASKSARSES